MKNILSALLTAILFSLFLAPFLWAQQQSIVVNQRGFNPKRYVEIEHMQDYTVPAGQLFVFKGYGYRLPETSPVNAPGIAIFQNGALHSINIRNTGSNLPVWQSIDGITVQPGTVIEISCNTNVDPDNCNCSSVASNCDPTLFAWGYLEQE